MYSTGLSGLAQQTAADVVRPLGAVQSQDFMPAVWSLAQRMSGEDVDERAVLAAVDDDVLRTHVLRPTWHFVAPVDVRWMLELTAPRVQAFNAHYYRRWGLDAETFARSHDHIAAALSGGHALTRWELRNILDTAGVDVSGYRLGGILMHAELEGLVCSGPRRGKQHTYALLDERAPMAVSRDRDTALADLTRRFFTGHGPATSKDFGWWSSLTQADIRHGLELVGDELAHHVVDGVTYWFDPATADFPRLASPTVHLLQPYDEYLVAYPHSRAVSDRRGLTAKRPAMGGYSAVVVLDTQVTGAWKRTVRRRAVYIDVQLYRPLNDAETQALHEAADAYGAFLRLPVVVNSPTLL